MTTLRENDFAVGVGPSLDLPWEQDVIALRRDFHAHPELGFHEVRTARIVADRLRRLGYEVRENVGLTGVVARMAGQGTAADTTVQGPTVLLRADMDALPVQEENEWPCKSRNSGVMHACAHDGHMAVGLSVARLLAENRSEWSGEVLLIFQPAEEGLGGAKRMLEDGIWQNQKPDYALALHLWSPLPVGTIAVAPGPVMAAADEFKATIIGRGGHGALPHETTDAILVASHVVTALQSVVARNLKPIDCAVVTVGQMNAGTAFNIIPGEAHLQGTMRSFTPEVRSLLESRCRQIVETLPLAFGGQGKWEFLPGFPPVVNNADVVERITPTLANVVDEDNLQEFEPTLGAEDMSLVLQEVPGCYFFVGGRNAEIDAVYPHHHPRFNIDEAALSIAVRALYGSALVLLNSNHR